MPTEMAMILFFTLVVGVVVFGGVTLSYVLDVRGSRPTSSYAPEDDTPSTAETDADDASPAPDRAA